MDRFNCLFFATIFIIIFTLGIPLFVALAVYKDGFAVVFTKDEWSELKGVYTEYFDLFTWR